MFPGYVTGHTDDGLVIDDLGTVVDGCSTAVISLASTKTDSCI
ncbi:hypothetical protein [Rhodococcus rhodochrous]